MLFDSGKSEFTDRELEYIAKELRSTVSELRTSLEMWGQAKRAYLYHSFTLCDARNASLSDKLVAWEMPARESCVFR